MTRRKPPDAPRTPKEATPGARTTLPAGARPHASGSASAPLTPSAFASGTNAEHGFTRAASASAEPHVPAEPGTGRRRFVVRMWGVLAGFALGELAWISGSFLRPRPRDAASASLFLAGPAERFEPGTVTAFPSGKFYLVRLTDGGFMALHRECTHLGCTVPWDAARHQFACPCHASAFDITGQVLNPPAPRPLDFYAVRIENGIVKVDTRVRLQRTAFDASQVTVT